MDRALIVHVVGWGRGNSNWTSAPLFSFFWTSFPLVPAKTFMFVWWGLFFWLLILAGDELVTGIWFLSMGGLGGGLFSVFVLDRACPGDVARTFIVTVYCILDKNKQFSRLRRCPFGTMARQGVGISSHGSQNTSAAADDIKLAPPVPEKKQTGYLFYPAAR